MLNPPVPSDVLQAWLAISSDLLALTDRRGRICWSNAAFQSASAHAVGDALTQVLHETDARCGAEGTGCPPAGSSVAQALAGKPLVDVGLRLVAAAAPAGNVAERWLRVCTSSIGDDNATVEGAQILWVMRDVTAEQAAARRERLLAERLGAAQDIGRLGLWERRIPSGDATWDRHVFAFWGVDPAVGALATPAALQRVHPDDRDGVADSESRLEPGRYERRYRVVHQDGTVRHLHSQWDVKASLDGVPERAVGVTVDDTEAFQLAHSRDAAAVLAKLTVDLAGIVHWRHDIASDLLHINVHGFAVLGLRPRRGGMPAAEFERLTHPDDLPRVLASAKRALQSQQPDDIQVRLRHSDGSWRHLLMRRLAQRAADGTPARFIGVALDITEQAQRVRETAELGRRLDSVAEAAGVGVWSCDPATGEGHWNRQMYRITGRPEALGVPTLDEWLAQIVHPADRDRMRQMPAAFRSASAETVFVEYRIVRPDGQTRWLENRFRMEDRDGQPLVVGVKLDITERRAAEDALRSADHRAALAARSAGIGTWEVDFDSSLQVRAERWDEQMFHLRGLAVADTPPDRDARLALVHPDDRALTVDARPERAVANGQLSYEFRLQRADGSVRWLASRSIALLDDEQRVHRRIGVNWDVTESKNADTARQERALAERENRAKSRFLSRMSHELRTPLNAVLGFTELLQLEASQTQASGRAARLGHIRAAGEHLLALVNDVLELSSLESGERPLLVQPIDLAVLAAEAVPLVEPLLRRHRVQLRCGALAAVVMGDQRRLRQVVINLLSNAIKFNAAGGEVWLDAQVDTAGGSESELRDVTLRVRDNGRGLSEQQLAQLFQPFNRLGVEREGIEGTGIGLVIVKALVEGMGGKVSANSRPGRGTVVELTLRGCATAAPAKLPAAAAGLASDGWSGSLEPAGPRRVDADGNRDRNCVIGGDGDGDADGDDDDDDDGVGVGVGVGDVAERAAARVLYIEDNPVNVLLVEELLAQHTGFAVTSEGTGAAGVARAQALRPDLVLIDMQLPDFDGYEVLRRLRADPATMALRCIALSANAMAEDIDRALAAGFVSYWTKPINFKAFLHDLQQQLVAPADGVSSAPPAASMV